MNDDRETSSSIFDASIDKHAEWVKADPMRAARMMRQLHEDWVNASRTLFTLQCEVEKAVNKSRNGK